MECLEIETMSHNAGMLLVPGHSVWGMCVAQRGTERGFATTISVLFVTIIQPMLHTSNRCADKALARPGRKQATATKPLQVTQKQFRCLSGQPDLRGSNDLRVGRKRATFQLIYQSGRAKDLSATLHKGNINQVHT